MNNYLNEIITYILSCILPSVNKDLQIQKKILIQIQSYNNDLDLYENTKSYNIFKNQYVNKYLHNN